MSSGIRVGQVWDLYGSTITIYKPLGNMGEEAWEVRLENGVTTPYWASTILNHFTLKSDPVVEEFDRQLAELLGE